MRFFRTFVLKNHVTCRLNSKPNKTKIPLGLRAGHMGRQPSFFLARTTQNSCRFFRTFVLKNHVTCLFLAGLEKLVFARYFEWDWDYGTLALGFVEFYALGRELFSSKNHPETDAKNHQLCTQKPCDMPLLGGFWPSPERARYTIAQGKHAAGVRRPGFEVPPSSESPVRARHTPWLARIKNHRLRTQKPCDMPFHGGFGEFGF